MAKSVIQLHGSFRRRIVPGQLGLLMACACSSGNSELASRRALPPPAAEAPLGFVDDGQAPAAPVGELAPIDINAVLGIEPAHGSFRGGQLALIRGNGFSSRVRVWFGDVEVPAEQVTATRADRVQVSVPAGVPGSVAVSTQNGDDVASRRVLADAYDYDAFYVEPDTGPTSGGSTITLVGAATGWDGQTSVQVDREPCEVLAIRGAPGGPQELDCRTPSGTEGRKSISVTSADATDTLLGAFSYEPGAALQGGLSGEPLANQLSVHVSAPGGSPIAGAYVILGSSFDLDLLAQPDATVRRTDAAGAALFARPFDGPALVTVAARCFQPVSFVDVPVDTVRAELTPVASPECAEGSPPSFGGAASPPVVIRGELVWKGAVEFQRAGWTNVPDAQLADERRAAYVLQPSGDAEARFRLPREDSAITLDSPGRAGYEFQLATGAGSRTLYALAGIENRAVNPPRFTAYAMGMLRGLYGNPGDVLEGLAIAMDRTLDQALRLDIVGPLPAVRGPDRLEVRVAVQVTGSGFAILPNARREGPLAGMVGETVVGLPALVGDLAGASYSVGAQAFTGAGRAAPLSVLSLLTARDTTAPVVVGGFVPVPTLTFGSDDQINWNRELGVSFAGTGTEVSLVRYEIRSGEGLVTWSVNAPPAAAAFRLPDLSLLPEGDLLPGALDIVVSLARVPELDYAKLESEQLFRFSWEAYAVDVGSTRYDPSVR